MPTYKNTSDQRLCVPRAGVHVDPGEVFESAVPLYNDALTEVKSIRGAGTSGKED